MFPDGPMMVTGVGIVWSISDGQVVRPRCARLYTLVFKLTLIDSHRDYGYDYVNHGEMYEVLNQIFQANLISKNSKSPPNF